MSSDTITAERPACDFCHARKIRCDRLSPCTNCVDNLVNCRRDRPRRSRRPRASRLSFFTQRLSALERNATTLSQLRGSANPSTRSPIHDALDAAPSGKEMSADINSNAPDTTPHRQQRIDNERVDSVTTGAKNGLTQQTSEARDFLQRELESNTTLARDRYAVLKKAINFVSRISNTVNLSSVTDNLEVSEVDSDTTRPHHFPPELLYMMTMSPDTEPSIMHRSFWPDHVSLQTLEYMCLSLIEEQEDRQTLTQYRVCVYMKAVTLICRLPRKDRTDRLRRHLQRTRRQYEDEILRALAEIDYLAPPCLSLLQALLSGALFMQIRGDMSRSWTLTAFASRTLVSLNYHAIDKPLPSNTAEQDIHCAIYSCYYLDKILSALLLRPPSLPKLKVKPADLVRLNPQLPLSSNVKTMVEFGQIQEGVLDILFGHSSTDDQVAAINALVQDMHEVYASMHERRSHPAFREVECEWTAIEFGYYALLTSILHMNQRLVQGPMAREECLKYARQSLTCLKRIQEIIITDENFLDEYPYFLSWTMLFFPLSPFFVLFCNVVYTTNVDDYELMAAVNEGLSHFVDTNSSVAELHKLFSTFLSLCDPLIHNSPGTVPQLYSETTLPGLTTTTSGVNILVGSPPGSNVAQIGADAFQDQNVSSETAQLDSSSERMWELLYSQPWLGWMKSDVLMDSANLDQP